ncbi:MAG: hypothetical protein ACI4GY_10650 [Acutalibacteraceae bacterium]
MKKDISAQYQFPKQKSALPYSESMCLTQRESGSLYIAKTIDADVDEITVTGVEIRYRKFKSKITNLS